MSGFVSSKLFYIFLCLFFLTYFITIFAICTLSSAIPAATASDWLISIIFVSCCHYVGDYETYQVSDVVGELDYSCHPHCPSLC